MRVINILALACALYFSAVSCSEENFGTAPDAMTVITANIGDPANGPESRSAIDNNVYIGGHVGILWTPDDAIGVFNTSVLNARFACTATVPSGRAAFTGNCSAPLYAYYPYSEANNSKQPGELTGSIPAVQSYDFASRVIDGDYKYGHARENATDEFDFTHMFSLLRFNVNATSTAIEGERLVSVTVTLPENRVLAGDFTFSAIDGKYSFTGNKSSKVTVKWTDTPELSEGSTSTAYLSAAPDFHAGDKVILTVRTEAHKATFDAEIAYDFEPNSIYTFDLKLSDFADRLTITDAPPVPALDSFEFTVAANPGKILDKQVVSQSGGASVAETSVTTEKLVIDGNTVSGMIPYLYDFSLAPQFSVPSGVTVTVDGNVQTSGKSVQDFSKPVVYTLTNADGETADYTVTVTNTGLPVVVINQSSALSSGSWVKWFGSLSVRSKDSDWATDDAVSVYRADGQQLVTAAAAGVRLRGNSTRNFPKKPFAIKFDKKQAPVPGLASHKRWVLLANWMDCSMMRNHTAFAIAHATETASAGGSIEKGLAWNPRGMSVELVINGRHVGNYYLCEQIKIGKDRLNIKDAFEDVANPTFANCGYLIECDDNYDENYKFVTSKRYLPFMLKDDVNSTILSQLQNKVNTIEANIVSGNYSTAYANLDINSLIDQWIVFELTMNNEYKHPKSVYMYMDGGDSKLSAGPAWDFDYQTFPNSSRISSLNSQWGGAAAPSMSAWLYSASSPASSAIAPNENDSPYMWYPLLFKDATFRSAVQKRWAVIYPQLKALEAEIAAYTDKYAKSWEVNNAMWPLTFRRSDVIGWAPAFSGDENFTDYRSVVENLRSMYSTRLEWMNQAITAGNFYTQGK